MTTLEARSALSVHPISGMIGAEVHGAALANLAGAQVEWIKQELYRHGVLFFPAQGLDPDVHTVFAKHFGPIEYPHVHLPNLGDDGYPEIAVISTANENAYQANQWHTDVSWKPKPSRFSVLHMQQLPAFGGDTMWSSQIAAYEALSEPVKQLLLGLSASHRFPNTPAQPTDVRHPVVIRHPQTGKLSLFVNNLFTPDINGLSKSESDALVDLLRAESIRPEFTCRRRWQVGDIAIWDNHFVQHNAIYDYGDGHRRIHRIEVAPQAPVPAAGEVFRPQ